MANEFKVKNGLIVIGELTTSGTITINGALAATQSWVTSQAYLTSSSLTSYATQSYVTSAIASLVDSAPGALDTLRELATALGNDASFSTTVTNSIAAKLPLAGGTLTGDLNLNYGYPRINFYDDNHNPDYSLINNDGGFSLYDITNNVHRIWVSSAGNVGIGTTNPGAKLEIAATSATLAISYGNTVPNNPLHTNYYGGYTGIGMDSATAGVRIVGDTNTLVMDAGYYTSNVIQHASWNSLLRVMTNGNVGIGTTSPTAKLDVVGNIIATEGGIASYRTSSEAQVVVNLSGNQMYMFNNSASYGLYSTDYGSLFIRTKSTGLLNIYDKIYATSGGNVGIGTSSPSAKLEIFGFSTGAGLKLNYGNSSGTIEAVNFIANGGANGVIGMQMVSAGVGDLWLGGSGGRTLTLYRDGNVGIGTTAPAFKLETIGTARISGNLSIGTTYNGFAANIEGTVYVIGASVWVNDGFGYANASSNTGMFPDSSHNITFKSNNSTKVYINAAGNVGIGTTSPTQKLDVRGNFLLKGDATDGGVLTITRRYSTGPQTINFNNNHPTTNLDWTGARITSADAGSYNGYLDFAVSLGNNNSEAAGTAAVASVMRLTKAGNVGIGTTSPDTPLFVQGGASGTGGWNRTATLSATYPGLIFNSNGTKWAGMAYDYSAAMRFWVNANNNDIFAGTLALSILNNGNIGIGTSDPSTLLHVNGVITATGGNSTNWNTAFGWGNHASAGYLTSIPAHTHTIANVTGLQTALDGKLSTSGTAANSELLDGVDESRFIYGNSNTRRGTNLISNWNQNDHPDVAFLSAESGGTNAPSGDYTYGLQYSFHRSGAAYRTQFVTSLYSDLDLWVRNSRDSDVFTSWKRLWHSGDFTSTNVSNWNTAYSYGNHASAGYATQSYVNTAVSNLVDAAPGTLDTLNELAAALGDDPNFATTVTNSIATKLPLAGGTMSGTILFINNIGTALQGTVGDNDFWRIYANSTSSNAGYLEIATSDDGTEPIYVRQYTGVFSSLTRTATLLDGAGNTSFPGNLNIGGFLTESSSLKLKENVKTSEGNLEKVVNLRPVSYNKIGSQTTELGLIAEEVAEVYPEFVQYDENGEPIGVNYSRLTAALIGAVKELNEQLQELKRNK